MNQTQACQPQVGYSKEPEVDHLKTGQPQVRQAQIGQSQAGQPQVGQAQVRQSLRQPQVGLSNQIRQQLPNQAYPQQSQPIGHQVIYSQTSSCQPTQQWQQQASRAQSTTPTDSDVKLRPVVPQPGTVPTRPTTIAPIPVQSLEPLKTERRTSLDDMLDELEDDDASVVLVPKVMTPGEIAEQKKQAKAMEDIAQASSKDPYDEEDVRDKLLADYEKLSAEISDQKFANEKWKLLNSHLIDNKIGGAVSVARCYPMKNRVADVLPFDGSRVELPTTKDDYINASHIRHLSTHSPCFVVTQWPKPNTFKDFWIMVWQEQVETVVALNASAPAERDVYWPNKGEPMQIGSSGGMDLEVTLQSVKTENSVTLRIMTVMNKVSNTSRVIIHLQVQQDKVALKLFKMRNKCFKNL